MTKKPGIEISSDNPALANEQNLVYQIAKQIRDKNNIDSGITINIKKNVPVSAGLGGGSSNAAMTIIALNYLYDLNMSNKEMQELGAAIGSDVNFFLFGGTAEGTGRGEKVSQLADFLLENLLLVKPDIDISSKEAYQLVQIPELVRDGKKNWFNRLEENIVVKYPIVKEVLDKLTQHGAKKAIMSGSGATCIGWFADELSCRDAQERFRKLNMWTKIVRTIGKEEYQRCFPS